MNFQSYGFLLFFLLSLGVTLLLGRKDRRKAEWAMLLCSLAAYAFCQPQGMLLLLFSTLVTFCAVRFFEWAPRRSTVYAAAVGWHILVLLWCKYAPWALGGTGVELGSFVPIGVSFFTFQQIWYLKECYEGSFQRVGLRQFALASFFYPTVSSGPILRPGSFLPQLNTTAFRPTWEDAGAGLYAIAVGLGKKVLLADAMAQFVDKGWQMLPELTAAESWCVILGYTLQLYFDFSGYCDMASGFARCMGIRLPKNFDSPYRALSISEFWKRWHITLTTFLRECVYFPLGGSRRGRRRTCLNILLVFLISGLWHGAGWTFLIWGLLHGLLMVLERLLGQERLDKVPKPLRWVGTFFLVNVAWVFFRAPSAAEALQLLRSAFSLPLGLPAAWLGEGMLSTELEAAAFFFPAVRELWGTLAPLGYLALGLLAALLPGNTQRELENFRPTVWKTLLTGALLTLSLFSFSGVSTFLYSNF
ncbi:MAG: MBOAT family O-acyltransferase [Oscillospiraceae bacterium]